MTNASNAKIRFINLRALLLAGAILVAIYSHVDGAEWALNDFAWRCPIILDDLPIGARVCHARFSHHGAVRKQGEDIRVTDAAGKAVNHELLRLGPGDQAEILFDCTGAKPASMFYVYFGNASAVAPKPWTAEAGVVLEVRKRAEGNCNNWGDFQKLLGNSTEVMGRILRPKIFDGYNPLGPNRYFISYYRAYFGAEKPGAYRFATDSSDASFLLVNGKLLAQYAGRHGPDARMGEYGGVIDLPAGIHKLEYYHAQGGGEVATVAAWQRPGDRWTTLMDDRAFVSVAQGRTLAIERANGQPVLDFTWTPRDHLVIQGHYIIRYVFECSAAYSGTLHWEFGDGSVAATKKDKAPISETHGFLTPGIYTVTLSADPPGAGSGLASIKQTVVVEPVWTQREEWDDNRWNEYQRGVLMRLESGTVRPEETAGLIVYAVELSDKTLLEQCAARAWQQAKQFEPSTHDVVFFTLGHQLQSQLKKYNEADRAFQEVIGAGHDKNLIEQSKLHRAGLLIHKLGRNQDGFNLLQGIDDAALVQPNEPILRQIFMADACAGLGLRDDAVKRFDALQPIVNLANRQYAVARRGRLLSINSYIKRGDYESALHELQNIEWETPKERISDETGFLRAECYLAQGDYDLAVILLDRLIKVNSASGRMPELLFSLLKAYKGLKQSDRMEEVFLRLKKEQPYAAETALAAALMGK